MYFLINGKAVVMLSKKKFTCPEPEDDKGNFNKLLKGKTSNLDSTHT